VEKVLNTKTVEGIEYKGLYTQGTVMPELTTYPKSIAASRIYDSGLVEESDLKEDYEQGMHGCVLMVEGKSWKSKFSKSVNPTFILQRNSDDLISQFENPESVFVDANQLDLQNFDKDVKRVAAKGVGFAVNISQTHNAGASAVQEISYGLGIFHALLKAGVAPKSIKFFTAVDSLIFLNIAKLRALRYLAEEVLEAFGHKKEVFILATSSLREQTLYDPWVNMLRNCSGSMAAILGGADQMAIRTHDSLFSLLTHERPSDQGRRSARNTLNIAIEESRLDFVMDPGKGSFALEELSRELVTQSWENFLSWEEEGLLNNIDDFAASVKAIAKSRYEKTRSRKTIVTGVNEFANPEETIESLYKKTWRPVEVPYGRFPLRRSAFEFEDLRLSIEKSEQELKACIIRKGPLAKLSGRINFVKNIFETMGLEIIETEEEKSLDEYFELARENKCEILIFCGVDDEYASWVRPGDRDMFKHQFIAGKKENFELSNKEEFIDLFMGKNIYNDLKQLVGERHE
ncbi:MAG: hypothetical protein KC478_11180, partial [Bacteriovoracaceae bacterium]|nr:hypothetical protein [Bacteriovoracaceae bacterium]